MKTPLAAGTCVALAIVTASHASAALVFQVGTITFNTPIIGTQSFSITVSGVASGQDEDLDNYQLPFDVDPPAGTGLPAGLTLLGATRSAGNSILFNTSATPGEDLLVTDLAALVTINDGNSLDLFTLDFQINSSIAPGTYAIDLNENNGAFYNVNGPSSLGTPIDGSITVTPAAVPEPCNLVFLGATGLIALGSHRRKRRIATQI